MFVVTASESVNEKPESSDPAADQEKPENVPEVPASNVAPKQTDSS